MAGKTAPRWSFCLLILPQAAFNETPGPLEGEDSRRETPDPTLPHEDTLPPHVRPSEGDPGHGPRAVWILNNRVYPPLARLIDDFIS